MELTPAMRSYVIKSKSYGKRFIGREIFYQGFRRRPEFLKDKGQGFAGGKHLLETLAAKFKNFKLVLTPSTDKIEKKGRGVTVFISAQTLQRFNKLLFERTRAIKLDAMGVVLASVFPTEFAKRQQVETYRRGVLANILGEDLDPRLLSFDDVRAVSGFAAKIAAEPSASGFDEREAVRRKRSVQLIYLRRLVAEFEDRLKKKLSENDWQAYFEEKILYFQDSYIRKIEKPNIATVTTQFPDFGVITADEYLDLIEIKLPSTPLLNRDESHDSYYWSADIAKAIAQVETYIESVANRKADLTLQIEKTTGFRLNIVKPRGIVIAGSSSQFTANQTKLDYFRMLNASLKNVEIVPYDELSRRLLNTVTSIEKLEAGTPQKSK